MKFVRYFLMKIGKFIKGIIISILPVLFYVILFLLMFLSETEIELEIPNPFDYCHLVEDHYTAIVNDDGSVDITEYITFDIHSAFSFNPFKEIWRELPEDVVDGLRVTYDVKSVDQVMPDGTLVPYKMTTKMYWEDYDYNKNSTKYYHHSNGSGRYPDNDESLLIYIPWTYRDKLTFKIEYTMHNASLRYRDCSELYLSMYSGNSIKHLKKFTADILFPQDLMPREFKAYTFGTAKSRIPFKQNTEIVDGYYNFSIDLNKKDLKFHFHDRYIEFCLLAYGEDKHLFTAKAPSNMYTYEDALQECIDENEYYENLNKNLNVARTFILIIAYAIIVFALNKAKKKYEKIRTDNIFYEPEVDYEYFREIPSDLDPIFASELVFMASPFDENQEKKEEYAAVLLSLMRKGYIKLTKNVETSDWGQLNTVINIVPLTSIPYTEYFDENMGTTKYKTVTLEGQKELEPLTTSERLYYDLISRHAQGANISLYSLQSKIQEDYEHTNMFVKDMEKKPIIEGAFNTDNYYFQDTEYDKPKKELDKMAKADIIWGVISLVFFNLISYFTPLSLALGAYTILGVGLIGIGLFLEYKANNMILFTQYGASEQAKWVGLYKFLQSDTLISDKNVSDVVLWEKYLIYATAFGISEKVVKAIKINAVNIDVDSSPILNHHCYIRSSHFHSTSRSFGRSLHSPSRGGGFGGHGYGGGGRRRRRRWRWPLK